MGFRSLPMESALLRSMCEVGGTEPIENCRRRGFRSQLELSETLRLRWNRFWRPILCLIWSSIGCENKSTGFTNSVDAIKLRWVDEHSHVRSHMTTGFIVHQIVARSTIKPRPWKSLKLTFETVLANPRTFSVAHSFVSNISHTEGQIESGLCFNRWQQNRSR